MGKRILKVQKSKQRRKWDIDPSTRVEESVKSYYRRAENEKVREMIEDELTAPEPRVEGRVLGIDYGERRIGLALSDPLGIIAQGMETLERKTDKQVLDDLIRIIDERAVKRIVVGLPLDLHGQVGDKAAEVIRFIENLESRSLLPVIGWDERMTTAAAHRTIHEMGLKARGAKGKVDRIAAILILQGYLDSLDSTE